MEREYDVVIVGGGVAGSALGMALAENGIRTLILEREHRFRDRVRGEQLQPWGVEEARRLGIDSLVRETCGHEHPWFDIVMCGVPLGHRDLRATTPQATSGITFYHPAIQEVLLRAAQNAGAEVRRGALMRDLSSNGRVRVTLTQGERTEDASARLVVGADGRNSLVRRNAGFALRRDPPFLMIAGVLIHHLATDEDTAFVYVNPSASQSAAIFPQGGGRARVYAIYPGSAGFRLQGDSDIPRFIEQTAEAGVPRDVFEGVQFTGPLASFDGADSWVDQPYRDGVVLIGDAAAANDPAWGQGLCLTLRDARVLAEALLATDDWEAACAEYAREHDRYYGVIHEVTRAMTELFLRSDPDAEARRALALPKIQEDPTRVPDHTFSGPDLSWSAEIKRRFYGED